METYIPKKKKYHIKLIVFLVFSAVVLVLLFYAFSDFGFPTGHVVKTASREKPQIETNLDTSNVELEINEKIQRITIKSQNPQENLYIGTNNVELKALENAKIVIENYDGDISFDSEKILSLRGKANKVLINNVPTSFDFTTISLDNLNYYLLKLEEIELSDFFYRGSGKVEIEKVSVELDEEEMEIKNFFGDLSIGRFSSLIAREQLELSGQVEEIIIKTAKGDFYFN
jgi:hypothetical protein